MTSVVFLLWNVISPKGGQNKSDTSSKIPKNHFVKIMVKMTYGKYGENTYGLKNLKA
jgi:hypothetical protein